MQVMDFTWFQREVDAVKWSSFYVLKRNITVDSLSSLGLSPEFLPSDYVQFLLSYGECNLFRKLSSYSHYLTIFAPRWLKADAANPMLLLGGYWTEGNAYFLREKPGIYSAQDQRPRKIADDFASWLKSRFARAKKQYTKSDWTMVRQPPRPFSEEESRIAKALTGFTFRKTGIASDRNVLIEVFNGSEETLATIEVGVLAGDALKGAVELDVRNLCPGERKIISRDCYKRFVSPETVELFNLPAPTVEDREVFKELRQLRSYQSSGKWQNQDT